MASLKDEDELRGEGKSTSIAEPIHPIMHPCTHFCQQHPQGALNFKVCFIINIDTVYILSHSSLREIRLCSLFHVASTEEDLLYKYCPSCLSLVEFRGFCCITVAHFRPYRHVFLCLVVWISQIIFFSLKCIDFFIFYDVGLIFVNKQRPVALWAIGLDFIGNPEDEGDDCSVTQTRKKAPLSCANSG